MSIEQSFKTYRTIENDTWDLVAFKLFGDSKYTYHLFKINPDFTKVVFFPAGVILKIPDIKESEGDVPPWVK